MTVGIRVGSITDEIGAPSFLHAFFSTVSAHCDAAGWASRFPALFELYEGRLPAAKALAAVADLAEAKSVLSKLPPSKVVWDIEDLSAQPPWGSSIAPTITTLGNYFVSSTGRDLFDLLEEALKASAEEGRDAIIE